MTYDSNSRPSFAEDALARHLPMAGSVAGWWGAAVWHGVLGKKWKRQGAFAAEHGSTGPAMRALKVASDVTPGRIVIETGSTSILKLMWAAFDPKKHCGGHGLYTVGV